MSNSTNTRNNKKIEIQNRIINLTQLLNNDPSNSSLKKEISDLTRRQSLEYGGTNSVPATITTSNTTSVGSTTSVETESSSTGISYT